MIRASLLVFMFMLSTDGCIKLLNRSWTKWSLAQKTRSADFVLTVRILSTTPLEGERLRDFYSATFEVVNVLKGWELLKKLNAQGSKSIHSLEPKIVATALGFTNNLKMCLSSVSVNKSYVLFLGYRRRDLQLVAKYDDLFGAAEKLHRRSDREILQSLGWRNWNSWTACDRTCGHGTKIRTRQCMSGERCEFGPTSEKRECNTFACEDVKDVLEFVQNYQKEKNLVAIDTVKTPPEGSEVSNRITYPRPASLFAPVYMFFNNQPLPKVNALHITFKGPVRASQYLFSMYSANHRLLFGVKVSRYQLTVAHDSRSQDDAVNVRQQHPIAYSFDAKQWYTLAVLIKPGDVKILVNCEQLRVSSEKIFADTRVDDVIDLFGSIHVGGGEETGEERSPSVRIQQLALSRDPHSVYKQCGKLFVKDEVTTVEGSGEGSDGTDEGSGDEVVVSGDEDEDRTATKKNCGCKNYGICQPDGLCICPNGWRGALCEIPTCFKSCKNGGNCTSANTCTCKTGYTGPYCQYSECVKPCLNGGSCVGANQCNCKKGFSGAQCQIESCKCLNGGKCTLENKCQCPSAFSGAKCHIKEKCNQYKIKMVSYMKPVQEYKYVTQKVPCAGPQNTICMRKKLVQFTTNRLSHRPTYICVT